MADKNTLKMKLKYKFFGGHFLFLITILDYFYQIEFSKKQSKYSSELCSIKNIMHAPENISVQNAILTLLNIFYFTVCTCIVYSICIQKIIPYKIAHFYLFLSADFLPGRLEIKVFLKILHYFYTVKNQVY